MIKVFRFGGMAAMLALSAWLIVAVPAGHSARSFGDLLLWSAR